MIATTKFGVVILAALAVAGCATQGEVPPEALGCDDVLAPSAVLALGSECDGRQVVVRGWLRVGSEMRGLWDSRKDIRNSNYRHACVTVYNPHGVAMDGPIRWVNVSGTFHAERPSGLFILGDCTNAILEIGAIEASD